MPFEDEFSHALRQAAESAAPNSVEALATGAAHRGERRRRRRTVLTGAAAVAAVACVGVLAPQLSWPSDAASRSSALISAASVSSSTTPSKAVRTTTTPVTVTADQLKALVTSKLPPNLRLIDPSAETNPQHDPQLRYVTAVKDGDREGAVEIDISKPGSHGPQATAGPCSHPVPDCTTTTEPDGSTLTLYLPPKDPDGSQEWTAFLIRPDGSVVDVMASNIQPSADRPHQIYPNSPLLDAAHLSALALDPAWPPLIAGLSSPTAG